MNNLPDLGSISFVPEGFPLTSRRNREVGLNGLKTNPGLLGSALATGRFSVFWTATLLFGGAVGVGDVGNAAVDWPNDGEAPSRVSVPAQV